MSDDKTERRARPPRPPWFDPEMDSVEDYETPKEEPSCESSPPQD
jgi:hypothetical protein